MVRILLYTILEAQYKVSTKHLKITIYKRNEHHWLDLLCSFQLVFRDFSLKEQFKIIKEKCDFPPFLLVLWRHPKQQTRNIFLFKIVMKCICH